MLLRLLYSIQQATLKLKRSSLTQHFSSSTESHALDPVTAHIIGPRPPVLSEKDELFALHLGSDPSVCDGSACFNVLLFNFWIHHHLLSKCFQLTACEDAFGTAMWQSLIGIFTLFLLMRRTKKGADGGRVWMRTLLSVCKEFEQPLYLISRPNYRDIHGWEAPVSYVGLSPTKQLISPQYLSGPVSCNTQYV